jgi:hypothetical protein
MSNSADHGSGFRIDKVSFSGAAGAVVALGGMAILLDGVPALRIPALFAILGGVVFGVALIWYRHR